MAGAAFREERPWGAPLTEHLPQRVQSSSHRAGASDGVGHVLFFRHAGEPAPCGWRVRSPPFPAPRRFVEASPAARLVSTPRLHTAQLPSPPPPRTNSAVRRSPAVAFVARKAAMMDVNRGGGRRHQQAGAGGGCQTRWRACAAVGGIVVATLVILYGPSVNDRMHVRYECITAGTGLAS
jgi:hypothetical protein